MTNSNLNAETLRQAEHAALSRASFIGAMMPAGLSTIESDGSTCGEFRSVRSGRLSSGEALSRGPSHGDGDTSARSRIDEIEPGDRQRRLSRKDLDLSAFALSRRGSETIELKGGMTPRPHSNLIETTPSSKGKSRRGVRFNIRPVLSKIMSSRSGRSESRGSTPRKE